MQGRDVFNENENVKVFCLLKIIRRGYSVYIVIQMMQTLCDEDMSEV